MHCIRLNLLVTLSIILELDTCNEHWQRRRDSLIIAAHVLSELALLVSIPTLVTSFWIKSSMSHRTQYTHYTTTYSSVCFVGLKPVLKEQLYRDNYDYIDKDKAEERGIPLRQNYAYSNPFKRKKKTNTVPDRVPGALYEDTCRTSGQTEHDIDLKNNYAYHPSATSVLKQSQNTKEAKCKNTKKRDKKLKPTIRKIYAPPIEVTADVHDEKTISSAASGSSGEGKAKVTIIESEPRSQEKPQIQPRKMYQPLPVVNPKLQNHGEDKKKENDSHKSTSKLPSGSAQQVQKQSAKEEAPKQEYSYVTTSIKGAKAPPTGQHDRKAVAPGKRSGCIPLKVNYAYSACNDQAKESGEVYSDGYVGPVVPPIEHTEGITLSENYAYKAKIFMKKK